MNLKTKQGLAIGLSVIGAGGTIATAVLVREAAKKEEKTYHTMLPFKKGNIKDILSIYKLPIAVGLVTVGSIIGSTVMSRKAQASLMSMAVLADQGWRKYKTQVKETLGIDKHHDVIKGMAKRDGFDKKLLEDSEDRRHLYYEEMIGWFQANPEEVIDAYASINEILNTNRGSGVTGQFDGVTLADFIQLANATIISSEYTQEHLEAYGWSMDYLNEGFSEVWVHMGLSDELTDDGEVPYKVVSWVQDPINIQYFEDNMLHGYDHEETRQVNFSDYYEDNTPEMIKKTK